MNHLTTAQPSAGDQGLQVNARGAEHGGQARSIQRRTVAVTAARVAAAMIGAASTVATAAKPADQQHCRQDPQAAG